MAVIIDKSTKIIIQGFTGKMGTFHADEMMKYGSNVVGGVTPGKGGTKHLDRPVFNTVKEAVKETGATASILFVPPAFAADSAMEAADAGIKTCVAIVDGIPSHDMIKIKRYMRRYTKSGKMTLVGPNCAGIISPGKSMLGIMPGHIYKEGRIGIISRSGTLGYEAAQQLKNLNIGVSTSVGIGGDPINGSSFRDIIEKFETDSETDAILMIGEIGGPQEVAAGHFAKENMKKPVIAYIAGLTAPKGRVMGHAGAIVSAYGESAVEKVELLKECGVTISKNPSVMGDTVKKVLGKSWLQMSKIKFVFLLILGFIIYKGFVAIKNFEVGIDKEVAQIEKMGFEKQDKVIGLMMYLGDPDDLDLIEHLLVENKEKCFEMKVIAEENSNAYYECAKLEAVVKEGKIIRIIEEIEVL